MPATKKKPVKKTNAGSKNGPPSDATNPVAGSDVLTLAETAAFLRVPEADVARSAEAHEIPARRIGGEWRFLRSVLVKGLSAKTTQTTKKDFWATHFGGLKDDPYLAEI